MIGFVLALTLPADDLFGIDILYICIAFGYLTFVLLLFLIARSLWASKHGDWIVIGFALTVAVAAVIGQSGIDYAALLSTLFLIIGIVLTMVFTRKAWD